MTIRRPRLTVRWLMILVALAGLVSGAIRLAERRAFYATEERRANGKLIELSRNAVNLEVNITHSRDVVRRLDFERRLTGARTAMAYWTRRQDRYRQAARAPWLSITTDPPEPEPE